MFTTATRSNQKQMVDVEAIVRKVVSEMEITNNTRGTFASSKNEDPGRKKKKRKDSKKKKKKRKKSSKKNSNTERNETLMNQIAILVNELNDQGPKQPIEQKTRRYSNVPTQILVESRTVSDKTIGYNTYDADLDDMDDYVESDDEITMASGLTASVTSRTSRSMPLSPRMSQCRTISDKTIGYDPRNDDEDDSDDDISVDSASSCKSGATVNTVGTTEFFKEVASRLKSQNKSICIQGEHVPSDQEIKAKDYLKYDSTINDFEAAFAPKDMRCLALVSHNEMKSTMRDFVVHHKHILKKFRLTGTQSTMKILAKVFHDEPEIVFGPSCQSGPLGGDAELVALMTSGQLGGILFFQDPMTSHAHQADIQCLMRQALVHNTLMATTPTTAMTIMQVFRTALMGAGKPELLPSFFFSLRSPTVDSYRTAQSEVVKRASSVTFSGKNTIHRF
jgi:methylglyoxal synthase